MQIKINDQYRISSDSHQWIIQQRRTRKGVDGWKSISYHTTIDAVVKHLGQRMVRESDAETLASALVDIENVTTTLSQALTTQEMVLDASITKEDE